MQLIIVDRRKHACVGTILENAPVDLDCYNLRVTLYNVPSYKLRSIAAPAGRCIIVMHVMHVRFPERKILL